MYTMARATTAGMKTFPKSASFMLVRATYGASYKERKKEKGKKKAWRKEQTRTDPSVRG